MNSFNATATAPPGRVRPLAITQMLTRLEQAAVASEAQAQGSAQAAKRADTQTAVAVIGIVAGVLAIPVFDYGLLSSLFGILLIVAGVLAFFTQRGQRNQAGRDQAVAVRKTDALRLRMIALRNALPLVITGGDHDPTIDDDALMALLGGVGWDATP